MRKLVVVVCFLFSSLAFADECFWADMVRDWDVTGKNMIQVQTGAHRFYELELFSCMRLAWVDRIAFRTYPRGSGRVCRGDDLVLLDSVGRRVLEVCPIRNISRIVDGRPIDKLVRNHK